MIASSSVILANLAYLIGAVVVAFIGVLAVWLHHRKPKSVDANVASFHRGLRALAPDAADRGGRSATPGVSVPEIRLRPRRDPDARTRRPADGPGGAVDETAEEPGGAGAELPRPGAEDPLGVRRRPVPRAVRVFSAEAAGGEHPGQGREPAPSGGGRIGPASTAGGGGEAPAGGRPAEDRRAVEDRRAAGADHPTGAGEAAAYRAGADTG